MAQAAGSTVPGVPQGLGLASSVPNPKYAPLGNMAVSAIVLVAILTC